MWGYLIPPISRVLSSSCSPSVSDTSVVVEEDLTSDFVETNEDEEEEIIFEEEESQGFHQAIKEQFIQGGWQFMGIVLLCLILGLAGSKKRDLMREIYSILWSFKI